MSGNQSPNWTLGPYIIQSTLLLIAPALFAATIYMILGRIIALVHGEHHSIIRLKWLTKIFVVGDCLSFLMQSSGPSTPYNHPPMYYTDLYRRRNHGPIQIRDR